jgi:hypothetical protein
VVLLLGQQHGEVTEMRLHVHHMAEKLEHGSLHKPTVMNLGWVWIQVSWY